MNLRVWRGGWTGARIYVQGAGCALLLVLVGSLVSAQTVYRWEDERGVVHFSDAPPRDAKNVESRSMPSAPRLAVRGTEEASVAAEDDSKDVESQESGPADDKPSEARVEIKKQDVNPVGDATSEFSGEVENVGGSRASDVVVVIEVTETNQGAHCLREEVDVSPSSLDAGEKGSFSVTLSNPCFYGPIATSVRPEWD
jgi:hypothetical protein